MQFILLIYLSRYKSIKKYFYGFEIVKRNFKEIFLHGSSSKIPMYYMTCLIGI